MDPPARELRLDEEPRREQRLDPVRCESSFQDDRP
jgi:hypothetical protein